MFVLLRHEVSEIQKNGAFQSRSVDTRLSKSVFFAHVAIGDNLCCYIILIVLSGANLTWEALKATLAIPPATIVSLDGSADRK